MRISLMGSVVAVGLSAALGSACLAGDERTEAPTIRVALYDGAGTSRSREAVFRALAERPEIRVDRISAEEVRAGGLAGFDVVIMPGGSGSAQAKALEPEGRAQVRAFVRDGGGYVGVCAGAYLATVDYSWSLGILDARVIDRKHWARGTGDVAIALSEDGRDLLAVPDPVLTIRYAQGPLLAPGDDPDVPDYRPLARFDTEIAKKGAPTGVMRGTTAIAAAPFGAGRVLCFSPHPELTEGLSGLWHQAIAWASGAD